MPPNVLIVENDSLTSDIIDYVVHQTAPACQTRLAVSLRDATAMLGSQQFDLVIADLGLPDSEGVDTAASIRAACTPCTAQIMLYSAALNDPHVMAEAHEAGFEHCIPKGANSRSAVRACLGALLAH